MWKLSVGIIYPTLIVLITGCSALLDPYNCESDGDCNGGVCMDGICVGEERQVDQMTTADAMGMVGFGSAARFKRGRRCRCTF